jgi:uncharacterized protein with HEPN domain
VTRDSRDFVADMLAYAEKAQGFVAGMSFQEFQEDERTQLAVIHSLEVVGEAARRIPADLQTKFPSVPWREVIGMRHVLAHDYFRVRLKVIYDTAVIFVPELLVALRSIDTALRGK